jgi:uncharacterized protein
MPLIECSEYRPPWWLPGGHLQTVVPALQRRKLPRPFRRQVLDTNDEDSLNLDWLEAGRSRLAILSHGLEGSSRAPYIRGMASALYTAGWDVLAWNFRGCGGEENRQLRFYHSGETEDLRAVLAAAPARWQQIALIGFSLGGNVTLKLLGEDPLRLDPRVAAAVAISVPCDLAGSAERLAAPENWLYMRRFLRTLALKVEAKALQHPGAIDPSGARGLRTFREFDDRYTAPVHGFRDAAHYWSESSSVRYLAGINTPTLLLNAANDPFLSPGCYPWAAAAASSSLWLEIPPAGGHVGFPEAGGACWSERRAVAFLAEAVGPASSRP